MAARSLIKKRQGVAIIVKSLVTWREESVALENLTISYESIGSLATEPKGRQLFAEHGDGRLTRSRIEKAEAMLKTD